MSGDEDRRSKEQANEKGSPVCVGSRAAAGPAGGWGWIMSPTSCSALVETVTQLVVQELLEGEQRDFLGGRGQLTVAAGRIRPDPGTATSGAGCARRRGSSTWWCRRSGAREGPFRSSLMGFLDGNSEVLESLVNELDLGWIEESSALLGSTVGLKRRRAPSSTRRSSRHDGGSTWLPSPAAFQWLDEWLIMKQRVGTRPSTLRSYRWLIETHIRPSLGRMKLDKIRPTEIRRLLETKADTGLRLRPSGTSTD